MTSYLEIKQCLRDILAIDADIDETCDIVWQISSYFDEDIKIIFNNHDIKAAYDDMQNYALDKLEISTATYREVALQFFRPYERSIAELECINDQINGITYSVSPASSTYCMFLLDAVFQDSKVNGRKSYIDLRHKSRLMSRRNRGDIEKSDSMELLPELFRACTLKVNSAKSVAIAHLRNYATSFEFQFMYKKNMAISEYTNIQDMYLIGNSVLRYSSENIDSPPQRVYNSAVLDYYTMAMEARDPFTMYISFYHIIEHYFDAVFKKKLTEDIREKITHPDFSYKNEEKVYDLAKYIKKHMSNDDNSGKGNEFESLKYVLMEYVPINELKLRIMRFDSQAIDYYQNNLISFITSKKIKIAWADFQGVYTNLATRIYETRNALVHSKSEQIFNQYRPYENKKELMLEIALIRSVAELVIINSSEIL